MADLSFYPDSIIDFLVRLLNTPSPTGYHLEAIELVEQAFRGLEIPDMTFERSPKGALIITWPGERDDAEPADDRGVDHEEEGFGDEREEGGDGEREHLARPGLHGARGRRTRRVGRGHEGAGAESSITDP